MCAVYAKLYKERSDNTINGFPAWVLVDLGFVNLIITQIVF